MLLTLLGGTRLVAQDQDQELEREADRARRAWFGHDASALVANSPRLVVRLPGADPSGALGQAQAAALLRDFLAPAQEVETAVRSAQEVEPGRGYVELQRRYKVAGTQEVRSQTLLLAYRRGTDGWVLVELRVST
ncbi:MAG TPA: hypothetical protein VL287_07910 [Gemmatimonadales bacterium]|jgi:hypothetical protein|nr:hypothetical protein [Gemmatimonadales bacterium]